MFSLAQETILQHHSQTTTEPGPTSSPDGLLRVIITRDHCDFTVDRVALVSGRSAVQRAVRVGDFLVIQVRVPIELVFVD